MKTEATAHALDRFGASASESLNIVQRSPRSDASALGSRRRRAGCFAHGAATVPVRLGFRSHRDRRVTCDPRRQRLGRTNVFGLGQRFPFAGVRSRRRTHHGVEHRNQRPRTFRRPRPAARSSPPGWQSHRFRSWSPHPPYTVSSQGMFVEQQVLVSGVPVGNHQTNSVGAQCPMDLTPHSGSTCNVCDEDQRNAALLWVNATRENTACWPVACAIRLTGVG